MGILAKVGAWIATNLPTIIKVGKKVAAFVHAAASIAEAHLEGRTIVTEPADKKSSRKPSTERPDFSASEGGKTKFDELVTQLDDNRRQLSTLDQGNVAEHRRIALQIDVMELIVCAQTFERFTNNVNIHAANLQIHLHTIRNTAGLLDAVNRQRTGIKALMGTVNHLINVLKLNDKVDKIEGIDIDMKQGTISIIDAYKAFEDTRDLLVAELAAYEGAVAQQFERVERVRASALKVDGMSAQVSKWLTGSVEPSLDDARTLARELKSELQMIPRLEAELRKDLLESTPTDDAI